MTKYRLEYIWLDGYTPIPNLRGKTQIKEFESFPSLEQLPLGSSQEQVLIVLGTPSTVATISGEVFYYISQRAEQIWADRLAHDAKDFESAWRLARAWLGAGWAAPVAALASALDPLVDRGAAFAYHSEALTPLLAPEVLSTDEMLSQMDRVLIEGRYVKPGELVVFLAGQPIGRPGSTNLVKLHRLGENN